MANTYKIFEGNIERLEKKLTRISNKCKKYGCDFHYQQVGEVFEEVKDENGKTHLARFILVEAEGIAKVNDWQFIATVEHTDKGNIIQGYSGVEVPERYYTSDPVCEHCNSKRYRKNTYIVQNTITGEFKQVGKSCLLDFTNGLSAEGITSYISYFDELIKGEAPDPGCSFQRYINRDEFLAYAAETIRCFGYKKHDFYEPGTAEEAITFYDAAHGKLYPLEYRRDVLDKMQKVSFNPDNQNQYVKEALAWVEQQSEDNNYFHNLKVACSLEYIGYKHYGLLASLFSAYNRELEYQAEKAKRERLRKQEENNSTHVGKINQRITIKITAVKCLTSWETAYGVTRIYKILDESGNVFTWKTGTFIEESPELVITGTVKAHNEYRGVKQTELTRCRVAA